MTARTPFRRERGIRVSWPVLLVAVLFGLVYAYDLFEAASNLFGVVQLRAQQNEFTQANGLALVPVPWTILIANLLLAPVGFVVALVVGRRCNLAIRALILAVGLCVTAAMSLSLAAFV